MRAIGPQEGRHAFGAAAGNYDQARPEYPVELYDILCRRCGLAKGTHAFEIGAGTGLATRRLLERGASPVVAIEPDARLIDILRRRTPNADLQIVHATFEDADLPAHAFDLGTSATAFHWMDQRAALTKVASLLKRGGWWAVWWNVFGEPGLDDPFHTATTHLFEQVSTPSYSPNFKHPFSLDREARIADIEAADAFEDIEMDVLRWQLVLDADQTRALYATFSNVALLDEDARQRTLNGIHEIAATRFGGRVERRMCTALYTARRR